MVSKNSAISKWKKYSTEIILAAQEMRIMKLAEGDQVAAAAQVVAEEENS